MINARRADENDSVDIFDWRNDEITREMSYTAHSLGWEEHSEWFAASLSSNSRLLVICEVTDPSTKVAVVRFDIGNNEALISINLPPNARGKGFAKNCLKAAITFFQRLFPYVLLINAEIKTINTASKRTFEGIGFIFIKEHEGIYYYQYVV